MLAKNYLFYALPVHSGSSQNLRRETAPQLPCVPDDTIKCIEDAKTRDLPPVTTHDDILGHKVRDHKISHTKM